MISHLKFICFHAALDVWRIRPRRPEETEYVRLSVVAHWQIEGDNGRLGNVGRQALVDHSSQLTYFAAKLADLHKEYSRQQNR